MKRGLGSPEEEEDESLHTAIMQQSHGRTHKKETERTAKNRKRKGEKRGSKVREVERGRAATLSAPKGKASYT